ncbi:hypothetical protein RJ639_042225 [Escallonia herrerae]|uniref:Myb-like domain-containing protein n=1 Tax=Escallonia herrerae TaxID=1293975 RepID=A0AA89B4T3_9ASTE|nr:hypothetical protein RJ639_042225 [Escallonia herrerae]
MLQGVSGSTTGNPDNGGAAAAAAVDAHEGGGDGSFGGGNFGGGFSEEEKGSRNEESERNSGGNRWPRQETLALLKIRSDMDVAFRDSSLKGPLWEEVSRKLAELGFHRSAKKCKEKFENVYKYHKRTKDGRTSKPDGKTYRFFDQLEALESQPSPLPLPPTTRLLAPMPISTMAAVPMPVVTNIPQGIHQATVPLMSASQKNVPPIINPINQHPPPPPQPQQVTLPPTSIGIPSPHPSISLSYSTSSSTSSDDEPEGRRKRKRKWKDFFGRLMQEVVHKQEELQKKFLDTLERRERDQMSREEAWRVQEMARMNREHDLLVQERSIAAAKDSAVIAFLQKVSEQQNIQIPQSLSSLAQASQMQVVQPQQQQENSLPRTPPPPPQPLQQPAPHPPQTQSLPVPTPTPQPAPPALVQQMKQADQTPKTDNGGDNFIPPSPSRWPKAEVQALIRLRTTLDLKYQENGPKGPLWEEISAAMRKLGYNRNAKRCKEKWENINKYYKKVKESNKKRPEDAKTCPYFHQLEAIYKEKAKGDSSFNPAFVLKPENPMVPIMARPEQQWPLPQQEPSRQEEDHERGNENESENIDTGDEEDEEDEGDGYEVVSNKAASMAAVE